MAILSQVRKNLKVLFRTRTFAAIILIGPLLVLLLTGLAFQTGTSYKLVLGTSISSSNEQTLQLIDQFSEHYKLVSFDSVESCIKSVIVSQTHACLDISSSTDKDVQKVIVYVDKSKTTISQPVINSLQTFINEKSGVLSAQRTGNFLQDLQLSVKHIESVQLSLVQTQEKLLSIQTALKSSSHNPLESFTQQSNGVTSEQFQNANSDYGALVRSIDDVLDEQEQILENIYNTSSASVDVRTQAQTGLNRLSRDRTDIDELISNNASISLLLKKVSQIINDQNQLQQDLSEASSVLSANANALNQAQTTVSSLQVEYRNASNQLMIALSLLNSSDTVDVSSLTSPIEYEARNVTGHDSRLFYFLPGLLCLVMVLSGLLLSATSVMIEKKSPAQFRVSASPVSDATIVLSLLITNSIIFLGQLLLMLTIAVMLFSLSFTAQLIPVLVILLVCGMVFSAIGMIIGYWFSSEQTAVLGSLFVGCVFLLLSDLFLPMEALPTSLQSILSYTPFVLSVDLLRSSLIYSLPIGSVKFLLLLSYVLVFTLIVLTSLKSFRLLHLMYYSRKK